MSGSSSNLYFAVDAERLNSASTACRVVRPARQHLRGFSWSESVSPRVRLDIRDRRNTSVEHFAFPGNGQPTGHFCCAPDSRGGWPTSVSLTRDIIIHQRENTRQQNPPDSRGGWPTAIFPCTMCVWRLEPDLFTITAPSSLMLYGELPEDEGPQEPGDAAAPRSTQRYIRQAQMMDDLTMNLVNLDGQLYLTSAEISALFFQQDVISSKLQRDNVLIDKVVVYKKSYPDLFSELILYEAPEIDNTADSVNLFPLDRLPLIIDLYSKDNEYEGLKAMALELLEWFDPQDPFWKGDDDSASNASQSHTDADDIDAEEDNQTQSSADDSLPSLDDLQQVLKTLEIKRKRILSRMLSEAPTADCVNELNTVELHISRVEALISKLESESATSSSSSKPLHEKDGTDHSMVSVQSTSLSQRSSLPNTPQTKTTHKVAPMVHTPQEPSKVNPPIQQQAPIESNPPPLLPTLDLKTLLQQQMLMNQMNQLMMQQLGLAPQNASFPGQLPGQLPFPGLPATDPSSAQMLHSFGRGLLPSADADQQQQLLQLQSQLLQQSGGSGIMPGLQNSQLFSQQQGFNSQLPSMNLLASCPPTATTTHSVPPGLGMMGVPGLARGRATAPGGRAANSQPQVGAVSPQPGGLQAFLQQPQPNFALSALQHQHQHQHQQ
ncbi:hypothetical protein RRG08_035151 [Elysia crispata]|uniref:Uncharacterized protein n=1 Tax=Elysia crispata TaxID=231223 RepID=A0AAE1ALN3_9GAST|nr:hypothetical protein RRG08_035151 [Elysia crispata]